MSPHPQAHLELLRFLSDSNATARQVALSNLVGFSSSSSSAGQAAAAARGASRSLLIDKHKGLDGGPLRGRDGRDVDTIRDLKRLCEDIPVTAHDAFSALINLSDSLLVARRIADQAFLTFLVSYICDSASILADLACMLLSNLTKLESVSLQLLSLRISSSPLTAQPDASIMAGLNADPSSHTYEQEKAAAQRAVEKLAGVQISAIGALLDAFEEGAMVKATSGTEEIRRRALLAQKASAGGAEHASMGDDNKRRSNCHFLSSVFANLTITPRGREFFVAPLASAEPDAASDGKVHDPSWTLADYPVARIMAYTEHPDLIRRGGAISALKNILFLRSCHKLLLAPPPAREGEPNELVAGALRRVQRPSSPLDILPHLLLPLCSGQELSSVDLEDQEALPEACQMLPEEHAREKDAALRAMLIECLLLLCTTLYGRQCLRQRGVYVVVRAAHLKETEEKIAESVVRLVNILQRDESSETMVEEEEEAAQAAGANVDVDVGGGVEGQRDENGETDEDLIIEEL
ncbi:hypothetical protein IE81DRAFT_327190 [Ceraceosorus guamensis]|uniref:Protein HGH1 homolog n=1 Tax=Ceraceosorus guamensis TaxID=1522189 RepID=A0A316VQN9_9BASI|nr:hypothetical protein IE81DRAFT_327190 [Ceraceosorus guamensis]PWN38743.1 hypothetical protein IE81DRAFT_327190 [Ceraceosorus guamensis]